MPASAPISEVLVVMPRVTISWVPIMAPTTQSGVIRTRLPRLKNAGCTRSAPVAGTASAITCDTVVPLLHDVTGGSFRRRGGSGSAIDTAGRVLRHITVGDVVLD